MTGGPGVVAHRVIIALTLLAAACARTNDPLPELAVRAEPSLPTMTPLPAPNPACIRQMHRHSRSSEPRKLSDVRPQFSTHTIPVDCGLTWVGRAEIDADGNVVAVRTLQHLKVIPLCRQTEDGIVAAVRQWKYEPACVDGQPVKTEMTVAVNIDVW